MFTTWPAMFEFMADNGSQSGHNEELVEMYGDLNNECSSYNDGFCLNVQLAL